MENKTLIKPSNQQPIFNSWSAILNKARLNPLYDQSAYNDLDIRGREMFTALLASNIYSLSDRMPRNIYDIASGTDKLNLIAKLASLKDAQAIELDEERYKAEWDKAYWDAYDSAIEKEQGAVNERLRPDGTLDIESAWLKMTDQEDDLREQARINADATATATANSEVELSWSKLCERVQNRTSERLKAEAYENSSWWDKAWQTTVSILSQPIAAVGNMIEGLIDGVASFIPGSDEFIKEDIIPIDVMIAEALPYSMATSPYATGGWAEVWQMAYGLVDSFSRMGVKYALSCIPVVGPALGSVAYYGSLYGNTTEEALNEGMTGFNARLYGAGATAIEALTEQLSSDALMGKTGIVKSWEALASKGGAYKIFHDMVGEGIEEVLSGIGSGTLHSIITGKSWTQEMKDQQLLKSFISGAIMGGISGAGSTLNTTLMNRRVVSKAKGSNGELFNITRRQRVAISTFIENMENRMGTKDSSGNLVKNADGTLKLDTHKISKKNLDRYNAVKAITIYDFLGTDLNTIRSTNYDSLNETYGVSDVNAPGYVSNGKIQYTVGFNQKMYKKGLVKESKGQDATKSTKTINDLAKEAGLEDKTILSEDDANKEVSLAQKLLTYQFIQTAKHFGMTSFEDSIMVYNNFVESEIDDIIDKLSAPINKKPAAKAAQASGQQVLNTEDFIVVNNESFEKILPRLKTANGLKNKFIYTFHTSDNTIPAIFVVGKRVYIRDTLIERFTEDAIIENTIAITVANDMLKRINPKVDELLDNVVKNAQYKISSDIAKQQLLSMILFDTNDLYYTILHMSKDQMKEIRAELIEKVLATKHLSEYKVLSQAITAYDQTVDNATSTTEDMKVAEDLKIRKPENANTRINPQDFQTQQTQPVQPTEQTQPVQPTEQTQPVQPTEQAVRNRAYGEGSRWYHGQFTLGADINSHAIEAAKAIQEMSTNYGFSDAPQLSLLERMKRLYSAKNYNQVGYNKLAKMLKQYDTSIVRLDANKYSDYQDGRFHFETALSAYLGNKFGMYLIGNQFVTLKELEALFKPDKLQEITRDFVDTCAGYNMYTPESNNVAAEYKLSDLLVANSDIPQYLSDEIRIRFKLGGSGGITLGNYSERNIVQVNLSFKMLESATLDNRYAPADKLQTILVHELGHSLSLMSGIQLISTSADIFHTMLRGISNTVEFGDIITDEISQQSRGRAIRNKTEAIKSVKAILDNIPVKASKKYMNSTAALANDIIELIEKSRGKFSRDMSRKLLNKYHELNDILYQIYSVDEAIAQHSIAPEKYAITYTIEQRDGIEIQVAHCNKNNPLFDIIDGVVYREIPTAQNYSQSLQSNNLSIFLEKFIKPTDYITVVQGSTEHISYNNLPSKSFIGCMTIDELKSMLVGGETAKTMTDEELNNRSFWINTLESKHFANITSIMPTIDKLIYYYTGKQYNNQTKTYETPTELPDAFSTEKSFYNNTGGRAYIIDQDMTAEEFESNPVAKTFEEFISDGFNISSKAIAKHWLNKEVNWNVDVNISAMLERIFNNGVDGIKLSNNYTFDTCFILPNGRLINTDFNPSIIKTLCGNGKGGMNIPKSSIGKLREDPFTGKPIAEKGNIEGITNKLSETLTKMGIVRVKKINGRWTAFGNSNRIQKDRLNTFKGIQLTPNLNNTKINKADAKLTPAQQWRQNLVSYISDILGKTDIADYLDKCGFSQDFINAISNNRLTKQLMFEEIYNTNIPITARDALLIKTNPVWENNKHIKSIKDAEAYFSTMASVNGTVLGNFLAKEYSSYQEMFEDPEFLAMSDKVQRRLDRLDSLSKKDYTETDKILLEAQKFFVDNLDTDNYIVALLNMNANANMPYSAEGYYLLKDAMRKGWLGKRVIETMKDTIIDDEGKQANLIDIRGIGSASAEEEALADKTNTSKLEDAISKIRKLTDPAIKIDKYRKLAAIYDIDLSIEAYESLQQEDSDNIQAKALFEAIRNEYSRLSTGYSIKGNELIMQLEAIEKLGKEKGTASQEYEEARRKQQKEFSKIINTPTLSQITNEYHEEFRAIYAQFGYGINLNSQSRYSKTYDRRKKEIDKLSGDAREKALRQLNIIDDVRERLKKSAKKKNIYQMGLSPEQLSYCYNLLADAMKAYGRDNSEVVKNLNEVEEYIEMAGKATYKVIRIKPEDKDNVKKLKQRRQVSIEKYGVIRGNQIFVDTLDKLLNRADEMDGAFYTWVLKQRDDALTLLTTNTKSDTVIDTENGRAFKLDDDELNDLFGLTNEDLEKSAQKAAKEASSKQAIRDEYNPKIEKVKEETRTANYINSVYQHRLKELEKIKNSPVISDEAVKDELKKVYNTIISSRLPVANLIPKKDFILQYMYKYHSTTRMEGYERAVKTEYPVTLPDGKTTYVSKFDTDAQLEDAINTFAEKNSEFYAKDNEFIENIRKELRSSKKVFFDKLATDIQEYQPHLLSDNFIKDLSDKNIARNAKDVINDIISLVSFSDSIIELRTEMRSISAKLRYAERKNTSDVPALKTELEKVGKMFYDAITNHDNMFKKLYKQGESTLTELSSLLYSDRNKALRNELSDLSYRANKSGLSREEHNRYLELQKTLPDETYLQNKYSAFSKLHKAIIAIGQFSPDVISIEKSVFDYSLGKYITEATNFGGGEIYRPSEYEFLEKSIANIRNVFNLPNIDAWETDRNAIINKILNHYDSRYNENEALNKNSIPFERWPNIVKFSRLNQIAGYLREFESYPKTQAALERFKGQVINVLAGETDDKTIKHEVAIKGDKQQYYKAQRSSVSKRQIDYIKEDDREVYVDADGIEHDWRNQGHTIMRAFIKLYSGLFDHLENTITDISEFTDYYADNKIFLQKANEIKDKLIKQKQLQLEYRRGYDTIEDITKRSPESRDKLAQYNGFSNWDEFVAVRNDYMETDDAYILGKTTPSVFRKMVIKDAERLLSDISNTPNDSPKLLELHSKFDKAKAIIDRMKEYMGEDSWNWLVNRDQYEKSENDTKKTSKPKRTKTINNEIDADDFDSDDWEQSDIDADDFDSDDDGRAYRLDYDEVYEKYKMPKSITAEQVEKLSDKLSVIEDNSTLETRAISEDLRNMEAEVFDYLQSDEDGRKMAKDWTEEFLENPFEGTNIIKSQNTKSTEKQIEEPVEPKEPIYEERPTIRNRPTTKSKLLSTGVRKMMTYKFTETAVSQAYSGGGTDDFEHTVIKGNQFIIDEVKNINNFLHDEMAVSNFIEWAEKNPALYTEEEAVMLLLLNEVRKSLITPESLRLRAGQIIARERSKFGTLLAINGTLSETPLDILVEIGERYMTLTQEEIQDLHKLGMALRLAYSGRNFKLANEIMDKAMEVFQKHIDEMPIKYNVFAKNITIEERSNRLHNFFGKLEKWRYMAMLSNPATFWLKNLTGNYLATGMNKASEAIGKVFTRYEGSQGKYSLRWNKTENQKNAKLKLADKLVQKELVNSGLLDSLLEGTATRYDNSEYKARNLRRIKDIENLTDKDITYLNGLINDKKPFGKNKVLNFFYNKIFEVMNKNDKKFVNKNIVVKVTDLMAKNWTMSQMEALQKGDKGQLAKFDELIEYATNDVMKTFFRNSPAIYQSVLKLMDNHPAAKAILKLTFPFLRMSINSTMTAVEYSPIGALTTLTKLLTGKYQGSFASMEIRKSFGKATVGSLGIAIGALLGALGWIKLDEDKEYLGPQLVILNTIAINIGDLAPGTMPLVVGSMLTVDSTASFGDKILASGNALLEASLIGDLMSMFGGGKTGFDIAKYPFEQYLYQLIPSVFKSVARGIDPSTKNISGDWKLFKKIASYIPVLSFAVDNKINPYSGEDEGVYGSSSWLGRFLAILNGVSPMKIYYVSSSTLEEESERVDAATNGPASSYTKNGITTEISGDKLTEYKRLRAKLYSEYANAVINTDNYKRKTDEQKRKILRSLQDKATKNARKQLGLN